MAAGEARGTARHGQQARPLGLSAAAVNATYKGKRENIMGNIYGYIRVSSIGQNERRQRAAMLRRGVPADNTYTDRQSGKDFRRPHYQALLRRLQPGDQLCVTSIDRLGRDDREIQRQWRFLTQEKKVDILVFDMPLLNTRCDRDLLGVFIADVVLQVLSFVAQNERENIRKRQAEGIAAARKNGVRLGRKPNPLPENFFRIHALWKSGKISAVAAAKQCGMARSTFRYRAQTLCGQA